MKKKLIEVALPLDAINEISTIEKSILHSLITLYLWRANRRLAAACAVILSQMCEENKNHLQASELFNYASDMNPAEVPQ